MDSWLNFRAVSAWFIKNGIIEKTEKRIKNDRTKRKNTQPKATRMY